MPTPLTELSDPYAPVASDYGMSLSDCEYGVPDKPLSTVNDYYDVVDWECSLAPYVDKLYWRIDGFSKLEFPNNIVAERK